MLNLIQIQYFFYQIYGTDNETTQLKIYIKIDIFWTEIFIILFFIFICTVEDSSVYVNCFLSSCPLELLIVQYIDCSDN